MPRAGFGLVEVLVASAVLMVAVLIFQAMYSVADRGTTRDLRKTRALAMATELLEQVTAVHKRFLDLPVLGEPGVDMPLPPSDPDGLRLFRNPGGQIYWGPEEEHFHRFLSILPFHDGRETVLYQADRSYLIRARIDYRDITGRDRQVLLTALRSRPIVQKPNLL